MHCCCSPYFQRRDEVLDPSLVLVGGTGRSGTTLLRQLLEASGVAASFGSEARVFSDVGGVFDFAGFLNGPYSALDYDTRLRTLSSLLTDATKRWVPLTWARAGATGRNTTVEADDSRLELGARARRLGKAIVNSRLAPRYAGVGIADKISEWEKLCADLLSQLSTDSFEGRWSGTPRYAASEVHFCRQDIALPALTAFTDRVLEQVAGGRSIVVDDTPHGVMKIAAAQIVQPSARAIIVQRDPFDVVASMRRTRWAPSDVLDCARFVEHHRGALDSVVDHPGVLVVDLEDLLRRPKDVLGAVGIHLGLTHELEWPVSVERRLSTIGRARTEISPSDREAIERSVGWTWIDR